MTDQNNGKGYVLVTSLGRDRPGIVEAISEWILTCGGNIEESRMSLLGNEFATLILVSGDAELKARLDATSNDFQEKHNLTVITRPVKATPPSPPAPVIRYRLHATSLDHAGIVHHITRILGSRSVNIVSAHTHNTPAPFTGTSVFHVNMEIDIPSDGSVKELRAELQELGDGENIDIILTAIPDA